MSVYKFKNDKQNSIILEKNIVHHTCTYIIIQSSVPVALLLHYIIYDLYKGEKENVMKNKKNYIAIPT